MTHLQPMFADTDARKVCKEHKRMYLGRIVHVLVNEIHLASHGFQILTLNVIVDRTTACFKGFTKSITTQSEPQVCTDTETWEPTAEPHLVAELRLPPMLDNRAGEACLQAG